MADAITPKIELAYHLAYALIIPICIGGALAGHIALTRALLGMRPNQVSTLSRQS